MTYQLPDFLLNSPLAAVEIAPAFGGSSLAPHVSIKGNAFTLIDPDGNEIPCGVTLDVAVIWARPKPIRLYYAGMYKGDSKDAPTCVSYDGVAPDDSVEEKQSETCKRCQWTVFGTSRTGEGQACSERQALVVIPIGEGLPMAPRYLHIAPGSVSSWRDYRASLRAHTSRMVSEGKLPPGTKDLLPMLVTTLSFAPGKLGVLAFRAKGFISQGVAALAGELHQTPEAFEELTGPPSRGGRAVALPASAPAAFLLEPKKDEPAPKKPAPAKPVSRKAPPAPVPPSNEDPFAGLSSGPDAPEEAPDEGPAPAPAFADELAAALGIV